MALVDAVKSVRDYGLAAMGTAWSDALYSAEDPEMVLPAPSSRLALQSMDFSSEAVKGDGVRLTMVFAGRWPITGGFSVSDAKLEKGLGLTAQLLTDKTFGGYGYMSMVDSVQNSIDEAGDPFYEVMVTASTTVKNSR